jgi:hypothetical protein
MADHAIAAASKLMTACQDYTELTKNKKQPGVNVIKHFFVNNDLAIKQIFFLSKSFSLVFVS